MPPTRDSKARKAANGTAQGGFVPVAVPEGMRIKDGIPVPLSVHGRLVTAVERAAHDGVHFGRTRLTLTDGTTLQGCVDCPFTHPHWTALLRHREQAHGAPRATRQRRRHEDDEANGHQQLAIESGTAVHAELVPASTGVVASAPLRLSGLPDGVLDMTLREVLVFAGGVWAAGQKLEQMAEEIAVLKATAKDNERAVRTARNFLNRARDLLDAEDEKGLKKTHG